MLTLDAHSRFRPAAIFALLRSWVDRLVHRRRLTPIEPRENAIAAPLPPEAVPPAKPIAAAALTSVDAYRRALERARRRHDKFVKPKGERPKREPRPPRVRNATPVLADVADEPGVTVGMFGKPIADEWMEGDGKGNVLYEESEFYGEFNFRDSILDQLDRYWIYLARMRKHDEMAYSMCRHLGATLVPYVATFSNRIHNGRDRDDIASYKRGINLSPWFRKHWPAFGCIAVGTNPLDETQELGPADEHDRVLWIVKFLYFKKMHKTPWFVQPVRGGHLYEMTQYLDRPHDPKYRRRKWGVPQSYFIWIADDGNIMRALKMRKRDGKFLPPWEWVLEYTVNAEERKRGYTPQIILARQFCDAARMMEQASYSMCRVEVSKGNLTAAFGIDARRMSYFFRDRDINLTADGATRPIFHVVKPHMRKDGTAVPMHFRGLRQFTWADYHVRITVPGRDHLLLPEFDVGMEAPPIHGHWSHKKYLSGDQMGAKLKDWMRKGIGGHA